MPKWKKDATEFSIRVSYHETRGYQAYLPRPIMEKLGDPEHIKFILKKRNKIEVQSD